MPSSTDWPLKGVKPRAWSPGSEALAIPLYPAWTEVSWIAYVEMLKERVRWMAAQYKEPVSVLEREWDDRVGMVPCLKVPEDIVDVLLHSDLLPERHYISPRSFPMKVRSDPSMVESFQALDLETWMMVLVPKLAD